jgi:catechol 2,3-dioxygenase-like lactoylglutathione lyase family enzyme
VRRAIRFYKDVLGAKLSASLPRSPLYEWASVELEGVELMFWEKEAA